MELATNINHLLRSNILGIAPGNPLIYLIGLFMFFGNEIRDLIVNIFKYGYQKISTILMNLFFIKVSITDSINAKYIKTAITQYDIMKDYNYEISYDVYNKLEYRIEPKVDFTKPIPFRYHNMYFYVTELEDGIEIRYFKLFNKVDIKKFLADCKNIHDSINDKINCNNKEYRCMEYIDKTWMRVKRINMININTLFWSKDIKTVISDVERFVNNKKFYLKQNTPYKRSYLLHGKPGTGKTTCARVIAALFDYDIYCLSFSQIGLTDDDIKKAILKVPAKSIILLEDIDASLIKTSKEKNTGYMKDGIIVPQKTIAISTLLNILDGITTKFNTIFFITTNHLENLKEIFDPAFFRSGRMDIIYEISYLDDDEIEKFFTHFYANLYKKDMQLHKINKYAAQFREKINDESVRRGKECKFGLAHLHNYLNRYPIDFREATLHVTDFIDETHREDRVNEMV